MEGLEQPRMEDMVETRPFWKLQTIGHLPNPFDHMEWTCIAGTQLALGSVFQQVSRSV